MSADADPPEPGPLKNRLVSMGNAVGFVLINSSVAFGTIAHFVLFGCLKHWYGIDGVLLR